MPRALTTCYAFGVRTLAVCLVSAVTFCGACGDAQPGAVAPGSVSAITLPTMSTAPPEPPPPPPKVEVREQLRSDVTLTVSFTESRKHPASVRLDAVLRSAPAWRAFPTVDPMRDLEWLIEHNDDMVFRHSAADATMDAAIAAVAQPMQLSTPNVKAWRGVVNGYDTVFLRAQPSIIRVVRAANAEGAARELVATPPTAPTFHANEALHARIMNPSATISLMPRDISEMRVWVDSHVADASADIFTEADCPDEAAARTDAATIAALIQQKNNFGVRLVTSGLLNNAEVTSKSNQVHIHVHATPQQIASVLSLASSYF
jgi:hypothetical protein